ncbi:MAG TPA: 2-C-methyl-D-erythritol 4-phosphate cytidylyltransferase [Candidatus Polarisedimenticolia bacterium]|nr:2-C-methyl-D-erythritol 4-phosphate cytidylyltransferase [Candidatus Polarisedimenticolia bacterium]
MTVAAIIVAAGRGVRMGAEKPKAFLLLRGVSLLERSVGVFLSHPRVNRIVAAVPDPEAAARLLGPLAGRVALVPGGATRQDSVLAALRSLTPAPDEIILVHDAARPLVTPEIIDAVIAAAADSGAAVPAIATTDTVRQVAADGVVEATLPRERLRLAQTPQGFRGGLLREAYDRAERDGFTGTDDAALVERAGHRIRLVDGSANNFKITTPIDLALAEAILAREAEGHEGV